MIQKSSKRLLLLFLLAGLSFQAGFSQYTVMVKVESMPTSKAYLYEFVGAQASNMLDSIKPVTPGLIEFSFPADAHTGMYRLVFGPNTWLDFVFNKENISLKTDFNSPVDSLKVLQSEENQLWSDYMNFYMNLNRKQELLSRLITMYEPGSAFYLEIQKELLNLQQTDPESASREIIKQKPESYVARFLKVELSPTIPVGLSLDEELDYILSHFFDDVDFNDTDLRYSPPLMSKINSFFGLYQQAFPPDEVEQAMIRGVNRLLSLAAVNDTMYAFIVDQLTDLFERSEFETFFAYFTENFLLDGSCSDESRSQELEEVLASIKKTEIGKQAPEIIIPGEGTPVILSKIDKQVVMVLFWASWCPHCTEMIPEIKTIYQKYRSKGFEIIAISLDKVKAEYEEALNRGNFTWINYAELKGWDSSIANDYGIRATPTMVLLDRKGVIIAKPRNPEMLESLLTRILK